MRIRIAVTFGILAAVVAATFVFEVNDAVGRWFLHWLEAHWCGSAHGDGSERRCWGVPVTTLDWIYLLAYRVPTALAAGYEAFRWGRKTILDALPEAIT